MSPVPLKRRKRNGPAAVDPPPTTSLFPDVCVFLVERRMGTARRSFLTALAQKKGFCVISEYSDAVTHVVSEQNSGSEVLAWIERLTGRTVQCGEEQGTQHLLDISWFTESMSAGKPVQVEPRHCLEIEVISAVSDSSSQAHSQYACQRRTPLQNHNQEITEALDVLSRVATFNGSEVRGLGFSRAASLLKSLTFKIRSVEEAMDLPWCGGHCRTVIEEILEDGVCREVEAVKDCEQYKTMKVCSNKLFTSVFGVGTRTAERWYREGVRSLSDLKRTERKLTADQRIGLQHYTDLQQPVTREEADGVECLVTSALQSFVPDIQVTMTGGFRRGKPQGHDVDFLITHPDEAVLSGLLKKTVSLLENKNLLLYHQMKQRSQAPRSLPSNNTMDGHETCYAVFALPIGQSKSVDLEDVTPKMADTDLITTQKAMATSRKWKAIRVDLVVAPFSEYPYALLGWTGSKLFERELRRFSYHEKKMSLTSHGLYDTKRCPLPATSEEEIFAHLGLDYLAPCDRNA
ncbi:DNA-directed DNA/RNA polymerase mu isoform 2-T4 [Discoglossus pictus]